MRRLAALALGLAFFTVSMNCSWVMRCDSYGDCRFVRICD